MRHVPDVGFRHGPAATANERNWLAINTQLLVEGPDFGMFAPGRLARGQPKLGSGVGGLDARVDAELGVDSGEVVADRLRRQEEPLGDLGVAQPRGDEGQDLRFALGQAGRMGAGRRPWSASERWQVADAKRA
jgi:hypothetical protein